MKIPHYIEILKDKFSEQFYFIDIGAYQGSVTESILKNFPNAKGILFEPTEQSYVDLRSKYLKDNRIKVENIALGEANEDRLFYQFEDAAQNSVLSPSTGTSAYKLSYTKVQTLDSYLEDSNFLNKVDFVKIDTQGNDLSVLKGSKITLQKFTPSILTECIFFQQYNSQGSYYNQITLMNELKYKLAGIFDAHYDQNGLLAFADLLFIHSDLFNSISQDHSAGERFNSFDVYHLHELNTFLQKTCDERMNLIDDLSIQTKNKGEVIFSLTHDLEEKEELINYLSKAADELKDEINSLTNSLNEMKREINLLSDSLDDKEKEIVFLSGSIATLKKRLSTPVWGLITLFQHHFPRAWEFIYRKKKSVFLKNSPEMKKRSIKIFEPRLGKLLQHEPKEIFISEKYFKKSQISRIPKLSIVTPSFNQAIFLERTIMSVLGQGYSNLEYIIQDGGSNDGSLNIIEKYKKNLRHAVSEKDNGQTDAINKGFKLSNGELMAWINSDDCYLPGAFNYVVNYFQKNPNVDVVYGHRVLIDENDKEIGRWILPNHDKKVLYYADFIPQETLFWRREIWERAGGGLDEGFNFALDWDLLLRFQESGAKIVRLPRFLASFRVHPRQKTSSQIASLGEMEMNILRRRYLSGEIDHAEIKKKIRIYLIKSEILSKLYYFKCIYY